MHLDPHLYPYKVQLTQQLKPADHSQRRRYVEWLLEQQAVNRNFSNKIFFSDEAHFALGGYVNEQNCRIWGSENPQVIEESPSHPEKSLFGALFGLNAYLLRYFFENDCHRQFEALWSYDNRLFFACF